MVRGLLASGETLMYEPISWFLTRLVVFVALVVLYLLIFEKPIRG